MARLEISLLGSPKIKLDGKLVTGLSAKAQALLFYLVVSKQQHTRERLAEMLFSDEKMIRKKKLDNLRGQGALLALNEVLVEFIESQKFSIAFKTESDYWLDVDEFERCLNQQNPTLAQLQTAVNLYQDDFLTGLSLRDAEGFEDWAQLNRQRLRHQAMNALYLLAVQYKQQGQPFPGIACVTRLLEFEPLLDEAHRELMALYAETGQISKAIEHYEKFSELLETELGFEPEKATRDLYQQLVRGEYKPQTTLPAPAPPRQTWSPPFQAPPLLPHFVGREKLQEAIVSALQTEGNSRIQAVVGMGGVGKSSLAGEIAHTLQEHFADGVLWATVAVSEPTAVLESWAQAYSYDFSRLTDLESMANAFRGVLADKQVLLVLDDVVSVSRIRPLLPNGPNCRVLLTTRDQDLAYGLGAQVWRLEELSPENGRRLLTHILGEKRIEAEPEAAAAICDLLQNLPLAVEIIGQRLKSRPRRKLTDIVQRLRDEKQRLSELKISDRAVRASFTVSYDSLFAQERQIFALMGVFHGRSFSADMLAGIAEQDRYETEDRLFALVALSLAQEEEANRYRQHPLLADFAREKLEEAGDEGMAYGRLARTYLTFSQQHQHDYDALRPEWDNLMAAMQAAHDYEWWQVVIDFADALHDAWFTRGRYTQARQGFAWVYNAALAKGDKARLAISLLQWGEACVEQNNYDESRQLTNQSLEIYQELDDQAGIADACYLMARVALEQNHYQEAEHLLDKSFWFQEKVGNELAKAGIYFRQSRIFYETGKYQLAKERAKQAYAIYQKHNDKQGLIPTLRYLAKVALLEKQFDEALDYSATARQLIEELQDRGELAATLNVLVSIYRMMERYEDALKYADEAQTICDLLGLLRFKAILLYEKSLILRHLYHYQEALECSEQSIQMFQDLHDELNLAYALTSQGDVYKAIGQKDKSSDSWRKAKIIAETRNHAYFLKLLAERESQRD